MQENKKPQEKKAGEKVKKSSTEQNTIKCCISSIKRNIWELESNIACQ